MTQIFIMLKKKILMILSSGEKKEFYFDAAGIKDKDVIAKSKFGYKVLNKFCSLTDNSTFLILIDDTYITSSEHLELQKRGRERNLNKIVLENKLLLSEYKRCYTSRGALGNVDSLPEGFEYFELLTMWQWHSNVYEYLLSPIKEKYQSIKTYSIHQFMYLQHAKSDDTTKLVLNIGETESVITLFSKNKLLFTKKVEKGSNDLVNSLSKQFYIPVNLASILKQKHGMVLPVKKFENFVVDVPLNDFIMREVPVPDLTASIQGFFSELLRDLSSEVDKFLANNKIQNVLLVGNATELMGFSEYINLYFNASSKIISSDGLPTQNEFENWSKSVNITEPVSTQSIVEPKPVESKPVGLNPVEVSQFIQRAKTKFVELFFQEQDESVAWKN